MMAPFSLPEPRPRAGAVFQKHGTGPRRTKLSSGNETASSCTTHTRFGTDVRAPDPRLPKCAPSAIPCPRLFFLGQLFNCSLIAGKPQRWPSTLLSLPPPRGLGRRLGLCWQQPGISGIDKVWEEWRRVKKNEGAELDRVGLELLFCLIGCHARMCFW